MLVASNAHQMHCVIFQIQLGSKSVMSVKLFENGIANLFPPDVPLGETGENSKRTNGLSDMT